ncbi:hypothetical protein [Paraburkholderia bengalensis]|uniref:hypothetical protein n=1 Tax=Paraburkholderia bengalensis TaxID=2747562 RepID=UPI00301553EC
MSKFSAIDSIATSWQSRIALRAIPLIVKRRFSACRDAVPDVAQLRSRAHRLSLPGAWLAALLHPRSRRIRDATLDGLWTHPSLRSGPSAHVILYLHGGGYSFGSSATHRALRRRSPVIAARACFRSTTGSRPSIRFPLRSTMRSRSAR